MPAYFPTAKKAEGNSKVVFVPTLINPAAPTVAEVTGGLDVSNFITGGNWQPSADQAKGDDRRHGSKETFEQLGRTKWTIANLVYIADPQAAPAAPDNEAYETLKEGVTGYYLHRLGIDVDTAAVAAQKWNVYPVEHGAQVDTPIAADDEFAKLTVTQAVAVTGPVKRDVALTA
jgi:hypothetical protein